MTREQEDNIMGWIIILMVVMFVSATCQAKENLKTQQTQENKCQH